MPIPQPHTPERVGRSKKWRIAGIALLTMAVVLGLVVMLWDWNWLRPLVEARASAALGRQVRMERLEVHPGRITTLVLHGVRIANPTGFDEPDVATVSTLTIAFEAETWLHTRKVVLPHIEVEQPSLHLTRNGAGQDNWTFAASAPTTPAPASASGPGGGPAVEIGDIVVRDVAARLRTEQPAAGVTLKLDSLEVGQGATRTLTGHGLRVTGPEGTDAPDVATIPSLTVAFESETWMNTGKIVLPRVEIGQPSLRLVQTAAGHDNWTFPALTSGSTTGPGVEIGDLVVKDGTAHLQMKQPAADVTLKIATGGTDRERTLVVDAKGTYDRQPITAG